MNRIARILPFLLALLTAVSVPSCKLQEILDQELPTLTVNVMIPDAILSKAETGTAPGTTDDRIITTLQIWVFRAGATTSAGLIGYKTLDADVIAAAGLKNGVVAHFSIPVDQTILQDMPNVDVYAVANGASAGFTIDKFTSTGGDWAKMDPDDIAGFYLDVDTFGVNSLVTAVPAGGIPMGGMMLNQPMTGSYPVLSISTVTLTRAVSKFRFVFCQITENGNPVDEFHITSIRMYGDIGRNEKLLTTNVFTSHTYLTKLFDSYGTVTLDKTWTSSEVPSSLAYNSAPGDYLYDPSMGAQTYENLIDSGVSEGRLTPWGLTYLRETDQQLTCTINYTVGVGTSLENKNVTFSMEDPGDFTRNHSWIIYGYFIGGRLVVKPTVVPWIAGHDRYAFATEGFTEFSYEAPWLRYDIDQKAWSWDDTWLAVAYGYEGGNTSGRPIHSIMFTLETINNNELVLQLNNDEFIFIQMTQTTDSGNNPVYHYTKLAQRLEIHPSPEKQVTNFYVVPASNGVMADPYAKVFLTELHSGDGLPPTNIPFNHNLPGDEDHTSILIYNPGVAVYNDNKDNHKDTSHNDQAGPFWLEEE